MIGRFHVYDTTASSSYPLSCQIGRCSTLFEQCTTAQTTYYGFLNIIRALIDDVPHQCILTQTMIFPLRNRNFLRNRNRSAALKIFLLREKKSSFPSLRHSYAYLAFLAFHSSAFHSFHILEDMGDSPGQRRREKTIQAFTRRPIRPTESTTDESTDRLTDRLTDRPTDLLTDRLTVRLTD